MIKTIKIMEKINIEVKVNQTVDVDVDLEDVFEAINTLPMPRRWNYVASIINEVDLSSEGLEKAQKDIVKKWLATQSEKF